MRIGSAPAFQRCWQPLWPVWQAVGAEFGAESESYFAVSTGAPKERTYMDNVMHGL
jgi:hypothetical protein